MNNGKSEALEKLKIELLTEGVIDQPDYSKIACEEIPRWMIQKS